MVLKKVLNLGEEYNEVLESRRIIFNTGKSEVYWNRKWTGISHAIHTCRFRRYPVFHFMEHLVE